MATRNIVPRANGEGSLGTAAKHWAKAYVDELNEGADLGNNASLGYRQASTAYAQGNIAYHNDLPTGWYLECTATGVSDSAALVIESPVIGAVITDGTVSWAIKDIKAKSAMNFAAAPGYYQREDLPSPDKTTITIHPTWLNVNGNGYTLADDLEIDLTDTDSWDTSSYATAANRAGNDVYIYAVEEEGMLTPGFILSPNATCPTGYTADTSRKIGGFHCLCVDVGTISGHTLTGYVAGDILPGSVWDLHHRAVAENTGMVWVEGIGKWVDIYLPSWQDGGMASLYGGTVVDGESTVKINGELAVEYMGKVGKELISRDEFLVAMDGSNQGTNIYGSADPATTGGHKDTNNRRMISNYGIEDGCGALWQWGRDQYENYLTAGGSATTYKGSYYTTNGMSLTGYAWSQLPVYNSNIESTPKGQCAGLLRRVRLGAGWNDGANCGSRAAGCVGFSAHCSGSVSARGVSSPRRVV